MVATQGLFKILGTYTSFIYSEPSKIISRMNRDKWWQERPDHRNSMLTAISEKGKTLTQIDDEAVIFLEEWFGDENAILAGNSQHTDRNFLEKNLPRFYSKLHYRSIDVTSFKVVSMMQGLQEFNKVESHHPLEDIKDSMDELKYILNAGVGLDAS